MEVRESENTVEDYSEDKIRKGVYAAFKETKMHKNGVI